jgi:acyl-coenzyme A synthetase/AMP-(fatty) acid ligase/thioesterase domain-containing protein
VAFSVSSASKVRPVPPMVAADTVRGIVPRFRSVVETQPELLAVADGRTDLSYAQLAVSAAQVLADLRDTLEELRPQPVRLGPDVFDSVEPVAMLFSHEVWAVAALMAVIGSGHPVLVLDPRTPAPRLRQFVERAAVRLILADEANEAIAEALAERVTVPLRDGAPADAAMLWREPPDPRGPAALVFTSGSTGTPKLVANDHRMLARDAWNSSVATGCWGADDVLAHTLPIAFHAGLTTTVNSLLSGATMRLFDTRARGIAALPAWIAENVATVMVSSPAIARALVSSDPEQALLASLRSVTVAGEAVYGRDIEALRALLPPQCVVRNRYGSSETGLITEYPIPPDHPSLEGAVPAGRGVGETLVRLVDPENGGPVAPGRTGIVTVTAPAVALGYWGDPLATAAAFRDNPDGTRTFRTSDVGRLALDGTLQLTGRADHSVKIRGYLVDPGEVDAALFALPDVREAVVVGVPRDPEGGWRLVAYVVSAAKQPSAAAVRAALHDVLPGHMVPEAIVFLAGLPRTDRGKIDRSRLPAPPSPVTTTPEELTSWEVLVSRVWANVLELERVGLRDDFFELGGDSLAVEALLTQLIHELGVSSDVATTSLLVQAPTLQDFAARLLQAVPARSGPLVPLQPAGSRRPLFVVAGGGGLGIAFIPWARRLGTDQPTFGLQSPVLEGRGLPDRSVESLARGHVEAIRSVQAEGPYQIAGHSFGGLVAFEMAHQLAAAGEEVSLLGIIDSFPPDPADHPPAEPRPLVRRLRSAAGLALTSLRATPGGQAHWRFFDHSGELGRRYRGRPWPGRALVIVAQTPEKAQRSHWEPWLSGAWDLVEVSGDHLTITRLPWADEVADALAAAMDAPGSDTDPDVVW